MVVFHRHVFTLVWSASSPRMRGVFFSRGIKATPIEQKRPIPLKWPSNNQDWLDLLATIYKRQQVERERGQKRQSLEKKIAKRATEYGRAAIVHC